MSSTVYGISGFVDGFVKGRDVRNSWEDRKKDRARQEMLDARDAETHSARMDEYGRTKSDWQRKRDKEDAIAKAWQDAYGNGMGVDGSTTDGTTTTTDAPMVLEPMGATAPPQAQPTQAPPPQNEISDPRIATTQARTESSAVTPSTAQTVAPQALGVSVQTMRPTQDYQARWDANAQPAPPPAPRSERDTQGRWNAMGASPQAAAPAVTAQTAPDQSMGRIVNSRLGDDALLRPDGSVYWLSNGQRETDPQITAIVQREATAQPAAAPIAEETSQPQQPAPPLRGPSGNGMAHPLPSPNSGVADADAPILRGRTREEQERINSSPRLRGQQSPAMQAMGQSAPPVPRPQSDMQARWDAVTPMGLGKVNPAATAAQTTAEAAQSIVSVTASATGAMGVKPGDKITESQKEGAAKTGLEYFLKIGGPRIQQVYLENGDLEGAQRVQDYMDNAQTKEGIRSWSKAVLAIQSGDYEGAADNIIEAYNNNGYFPDGVTIDKAKSGLVYENKAKPNEPTGARITFKDPETGQTWVQNFADPEDFMSLAMTMVSPEAGYTQYAAQVQAQTAARAEAEAADRKLALDQSNDQAKAINAAALEIYSQSSLDPAAKVTYEQARQMAADAMSGQAASPLDGQDQQPPVAFRPSN